MPNPQLPNANGAWLGALNLLTGVGTPVTGRDGASRDWPHVTFSLRLDDPVVTIGARQFNGRQAVNQALELIEHSAYRQQLSELEQELVTNPASHEATALLASTSTRGTLCSRALAMTFQIVQGELNAHAFVSAASAWDQLPNDLFRFAMVGHHLLTMINQRRLGTHQAAVDRYENGVGPFEPVQPNALYVTVGVLHLPAHQLAAAQDVVASWPHLNERGLSAHPKVPWRVFDSEAKLVGLLDRIADGSTHESQQSCWWRGAWWKRIRTIR